MIPDTSQGLEPMGTEAERQIEEVASIFASHPRAALEARQDERTWSAAGHVAHLCIVNEAYLDALEARLRAAAARGGPLGEGPYRHPRLARWFVATMEPPPKRRLKTLRAMVPDPATDARDVAERFASAQRRLIRAIGEAKGFDLGKIRFRSPFSALVRLSLGAGLELLLAHNRRHLWLVGEALEMPRSR